MPKNFVKSALKSCVQTKSACGAKGHFLEIIENFSKQSV